MQKVYVNLWFSTLYYDNVMITQGQQLPNAQLFTGKIAIIVWLLAILGIGY